MATYKEGNNTNSNNFNNYTHYSNTFSNSLPSIVRVTDIVLNENHDKFSEVGGWNGIGVIFFEDILNANKLYPGFAYPLNPQIKCYPLVNEIVFLKHASIKFLTPGRDELNSDQKDDYDLVGNGVFIRRIDNLGTEIDLNSTNESQATFVEKKDIHPLLSFAGDTIYEGRYGQSLRFGSTSNCHLSEPKGNKKSSIENNWSNSGKNGDPITILRNGQPLNSSIEGWIPITEDINKDLSSIYLTSTQKVPFSLANENFYSYDPTNYLPAKPAIYNNNQIILHSSRISINAKSDSVLISGESSVGISSNNSINLEGKKIFIDSNDIRLGSKIAEQPILLGNDTVEYLKMIVQEISNLASALKSNQIWPGGAPAPDAAMLSVASTAELNLERILFQIDSIKSVFVKTI